MFFEFSSLRSDRLAGSMAMEAHSQMNLELTLTDIAECWRGEATDSQDASTQCPLCPSGR